MFFGENDIIYQGSQNNDRGWGWQAKPGGAAGNRGGPCMSATNRRLRGFRFDVQRSMSTSGARDGSARSAHEVTRDLRNFRNASCCQRAAGRDVPGRPALRDIALLPCPGRFFHAVSSARLTYRVGPRCLTVAPPFRPCVGLAASILAFQAKGIFWRVLRSDRRPSRGLH